MGLGRAGEGTLMGMSAVAGGLLCLHYGRVGFMPLDQSIVFDGGWRVLNGQVPFRDFTTPSGLTPILLQAAFFRAGGVTWFAYCLHAAVFNGLFCMLVFAFLRLLGGSAALSFFYALASGVVMYPPFGVPYMDQHAFFFLLLFVLCLVSTFRAQRPAHRALAAAGLPAAAVLAFLSKQTPTLLALPLLVLLPACSPRRERGRMLGLSLAAGLVLAMGLTAIALLLEVRAGDVKEYFFALPAAIGEARIRSLFPRGVIGGVAEATASWGLLSVPLVHVSSVAILAVAVRWRRLARSPDASLVWLRLLLAEYLLLICALAAILTKNEPENSVPYAFASLGLAHLNLGQVLVRSSEGQPNPAAGSRWRPVILALLVAVAALDAYRFNARVNATRLVHGVEESPSPDPSGELPAALSFMVWRLPAFYTYNAGDLSRLVSFLQAQPEAFFLVGDTSVVYGLTGKPSVNPSLWFHRRLTMPGRLSAAFPAYEDRLLAHLARWRVRFVVLEHPATFMGTGLRHFPALVKQIGAQETSRRTFGGFEVIELKQPVAPPVAPRERPSSASRP